MIHNPCSLLKRLMQEPHETSWLEFKMNANFENKLIGEYVSSLANSALLAGRDFGYLVFGVHDVTREMVGCEIKLQTRKQGNEDFTNWLTRMIDPALMIDVIDFDCEGLNFSIIAVEPSYERPVTFAGDAYVRIGQNKKKLNDYPEHQRAIWFATGKRRFETAIALSNKSPDDVNELLDIGSFFELSGLSQPRSPLETLKVLVENGILIDNMDERFDITNLGALLLARDLRQFPSVSSKSARIIKYVGRDKTQSEFEQVGRK